MINTDTIKILASLEYFWNPDKPVCPYGKDTEESRIFWAEIAALQIEEDSHD